MAKLNIELMKRLVTRFRRMRHRKHFKMKVLAEQTECGTAMCIAGHALDLAGYKRRWSADDSHPRWIKPNGKRERKPLTAARKLLGLTPAEALVQGNFDRYSGLFYRFDLRTPKQAAAAIQEMIDNVQRT